MSVLQLGFVAVYLLGRVFFYDMQIILSGKTVRRKALIRRALWGLWLLFFAPNALFFIFSFLVYLGLIGLDSFVRSRKLSLNRWYYAGHFAVLLFVWFVLLPYGHSVFAGRENPFNLLHFFNSDDVVRYLLIFDGFLLTQKEATIFIRLILQRLKAVPTRKPENRKKDQREYELGRIIGLLERMFLYFLIIWNQVGAIAILIALKSLARFKELEDRTFAEYFLIGSLLSILTAAIPAVVVLLVK